MKHLVVLDNRMLQVDKTVSGNKLCYKFYVHSRKNFTLKFQRASHQPAQSVTGRKNYDRKCAQTFQAKYLLLPVSTSSTRNCTNSRAEDTRICKSNNSLKCSKSHNHAGPPYCMLLAVRIYSTMTLTFHAGPTMF